MVQYWQLAEVQANRPLDRSVFPEGPGRPHPAHVGRPALGDPTSGPSTAKGLGTGSGNLREAFPSQGGVSQSEDECSSISAPRGEAGRCLGGRGASEGPG